MPRYQKNDRGYNFEPGDSARPRQRQSAPAPDEIRFDDDFDAIAPTSPRRARPSGRYSPERHDARQEDAFDNYRPGSMLDPDAGRDRSEPEPLTRRRSARISDDYDARFDDDFDDDILPRRKAAAPSIYDYRPPQRGGYSRANHYGEDYDEAQFQREFGGIKGLGVRKRQLTEAEQIEQRRQERLEREEMERDGYRGGREMMVDQVYDGSVGVPKLFADYFRDDYEQPTRRVLINGGKSSYVTRRANKMLSTAGLAVLVLAVIVGAIVFISANRVSTPLNVSTALSSMDTNTSMQLIKNTVDGTLDTKTIPVNYTGENGQSGSGTFRLADCDFEYTSNEDGTVEYLEVTEDDGTKVNHTLRTVGSIRYDETKVIDFLNELVGEDGTPMVEPTYDVDILLDPETWEHSAEMTLRAGVDGFGIDYDKFIEKAITCINTGVYEPISSPLEITYTPAIDLESIHDQVYTEPADAYSVTDGMGQVTYTEHVIGLDFDTSSVQNTITHSNETEWTVDLDLTMPKLTIQELRKDECPDLLATYYTEFNAGNVGRTSNIEKCCEYINNYYRDNPMQPGDVFSFNTIVGERTPDRGFSKATVYSSEGTDEDYGGGICLVSSTLYYTTILANLKIEHRRNHMYTVSYMTRAVPDENGKRQSTFANDATVNWGTCDFKFSNSKQYPIRIELIASGGVLTCNIWGTWDGFTADFGYDEIDTEPYPTIYHRYNPEKSNQAGQLGRTIDSYRIVYYNGEEYDRFHEAESTYLPLMQVKYTNDIPAGKEFDVAY